MNHAILLSVRTRLLLSVRTRPASHVRTRSASHVRTRHALPVHTRQLLSVRTRLASPVRTQSLNRPNRGYSLLNLIVTTAITMVLASIAIPSFAALMSKTVVESSSSNLQHSLALARQYAVVNHTIVQVCRMADDDQSQCHQQRGFNESWSQGWMVFGDTNRNNELDDNDKILNVTQNNTKSNVVFNQRGRLRFFPDGTARSAGFYVCGRDQKHYRHVVLLHTGRTRTSATLDSRQRGICDNNGT